MTHICTSLSSAPLNVLLSTLPSFHDATRSSLKCSTDTGLPDAGRWLKTCGGRSNADVRYAATRSVLAKSIVCSEWSGKSADTFGLSIPTKPTRWKPFTSTSNAIRLPSGSHLGWAQEYEKFAA